MIFYNDEGTENGGLIFRGQKVNDKVNHGLHMSFDRYNQDQTLMMQHIEMENYMISGLTVMDRPNTDLDFEMTNRYLEAQKREDIETMQEIEKYLTDNKLLGARRAFYGTLNGDSRLQLNDANGQKRIQMVVTKAGEAKLEFLDKSGKVIMSLPDSIAE
jgi:alpha-D-ribose 1-methylphosphonate 5-triphosphate diphosphatase PhnM